MTNKKPISVVVPEEYAKKRLDQTLAALLPDYSRAQLQTWIKTGHVLVDGTSVKANTKLVGNELIEVQAQPRTEEPWEAQDIPLQIVHEDDDIIIINKPVGLIVHPGSGVSKNTMLNALLHHSPQLKTLPRAGIIHRLDKNTSGLLVIAKTDAAYNSLNRQLKDRTISREYQTIVYGDMISGGTIDKPIDRHPLDRKRMAVIEDGREAVTHYRIAEKFPALTHLFVKLETGRTHQIRVHMSHIRHPIVGDSTYGGRVKLAKGMSDELIQGLRGFKRQALHAFALGFTHPGTNEEVKYTIDLPEDMQQLLTILRHDKERTV